MPPVPNISGPSKKSADGKKDKKKMVMRAQHRRRQQEEHTLKELVQAVDSFDPSTAELFAGLPLSLPTQRALRAASYTTPTTIQARTLQHTLRGRDVLGAARTGSGKTLAFLLPVLELLWRSKWGPQDGLGALIISPTRELAMQIFEVLRSVGQYHSFSAGLVIGGKNVRDEQERLTRMNILVATPGRLLQHMDQTAGFATDNLQILVLDEADRILDMGFSHTINAIIANLPKTRQTLLFSATQTQSVKDLARLSLKDPEFVSVREAGQELATPKNLEQHYLVCELDKKLDVLYSFIKAHLKSKALVFLSSGKQVRFVFEAFRKLQPGIPLLHLLGKQKLAKRMDIFQRFTSSTNAVLFATDIAARGLDFPAVDWVVQLDAPEDADTYIHRVGRTARYDSAGKALLFLLPNEEEGMLKELERKEVRVEKIKVKESKTQSVAQSLQSFCFKDPEMKYLGQRAFVSYLRSVWLQKNKEVFNLEEMPIKKFAASLGLPGAPRIRFRRGQGEDGKEKKNKSRTLAAEGNIRGGKKGSEDEDDSGDSEQEGDNEDDEDAAATQFAAAVVEATMEEPETVAPTKTKSTVRTKYDRMFERKNQNILSAHYTKLVDHTAEGDADDSEDFLTLKRVDHALEEDEDGPGSNDLSKRKLKIGQSKKARLRFKGAGTKLVFDDEGEGRDAYALEDDTEFNKGDVKAAGREFAEREREQLKVVDVVDRETVREKRREKKRRRKERERDMAGGAEDEDGPVLARGEEEGDADDGYVSPDFGFIPDESEEEKEGRPAKKRKKRMAFEREGREDLDAQEALALELLQGAL
ncbi:DEAD-domain-containing protein [Dacryopinax primogenitus]|uniref:ATP-dependent RNA helicase n=1 Tax=Dacryopinax primogenitus (strain DJM 731) TaxID=1858805 RepID=M5FXR7_DACPD|nr:DEAD-domain-containing protein [Dacryopinax primogenitus]EJU01294.1 DEAD-domain-containing protein [Dacryopinax primogenitus]